MRTIHLDEKQIKHFWSKVDIRGGDECWEWKAYIDPDGYGMFDIGKSPHGTHRVAWTIANGRSPRPGFNIAHAPIICHNRACCNPAHLSEKTPKENSDDMQIDNSVARGAKNGKHTHPERTPLGEKHGRSKITEAKVIETRKLLSQNLSIRAVGKIIGISKSQVSNIKHKVHWKHVP